MKSQEILPNPVNCQARQQRGLWTVKTKLPTDEEIFRFQMALTTWPRGNPIRFLRFEQLEEV